jgi:O-antigen ligase
MTAVKHKSASALEAFACMAMTVCLFVMHRSGIYEAVALPLQIVLSLCSFSNPITGIFYLSAAQVIPDPPGIALSSSQLAIAGFFLWHVLKFDFKDVRATSLFLSMAAPFVIWCAACSFLPGGWGLRTVLVLIYCMLTGYAAIILCRRSGNRVIHCVIAFLTAQALASSMYWMIYLNLGTPVEIFDWELYGSSLREGARMGTSRGNANTLGVPMALALSGVVLVVLGGVARIRNHGIYWICGGAILFLLCFPALIAAGTRGAMVSLAVGVSLAFVNRRIFMLHPLLTFGVVAAVLFLGALCWKRFGLGRSWEEIERRVEYYQTTQASSFLAGRDVVWQEAFAAVLKSPIIGGGKPEIVSYAGREEMWASHSTYLDAGLIGGIPALLFFMGFIIYPVYFCWKHRHIRAVWMFLTSYAVAASTLTSLSGIQYKYIWMLWALFSVWVPRFPASSGLRSRLGITNQRKRRALLLPEPASEH